MKALLLITVILSVSVGTLSLLSGLCVLEIAGRALLFLGRMVWDD